MTNKFPRKLKLLSKIEKVEEAAYFAEKAAKDMDFSESDVDDIAIATTEAVSNAIIHGNKSDVTKKVVIEIMEKPDRMIINVWDEGVGFDPHTIDDPLLPENLLRESGRGVFILKSLMDRVDYSFEKNGTVIILEKRKKK